MAKTKEQKEAAKKEYELKKAQVEAPQVEAPQVEAPQAEAPQAEAPQAEAPQAEAPQAEAPQADKTLEEAATEVTLKVNARARLQLGKADLTAQEDSLLREVVQLQFSQEGRAVEQKNITQDMVDELCQYGSFLGRLGWLRAKYHESMKKK